MTQTSYLIWLEEFLRDKKSLTDLDINLIKNKRNSINGGIIEYKLIEHKQDNYGNHNKSTITSIYK